MEAKDVKISKISTMKVLFRTFFRVVPPIPTLVFCIPGTLFLVIQHNIDKPIPLAIAILMFILCGVLGCVVVFLLGPLIKEGLKDHFLPYVRDQYGYELEKEQREALRRVDDVILEE